MMKTLVLAATLVMVGQAAQAEVIKAVCQVRLTKPGLNQTGMRRLLIDTDAKTVRVWDSAPHGWTMKGAHPIVGVQGSRIVLDQDAVKTSTLDRRNGAYSFHNNADKVTIEGRCKKVG